MSASSLNEKFQTKEASETNGRLCSCQTGRSSMWNQAEIRKSHGHKCQRADRAIQQWSPRADEVISFLLTVMRGSATDGWGSWVWSQVQSESGPTFAAAAAAAGTAGNRLVCVQPLGAAESHWELLGPAGSRWEPLGARCALPGAEAAARQLSPGRSEREKRTE